jgi:hypothetical protein
MSCPGARVGAVLALVASLAAALQVEVIRSTGGLPAHLVGRFAEPLAFQEAADGTAFVFDRRGHAVYRIDPDRQTARKIVEIGFEEGRILEPGAFDLEPNGSFVVADGPNGRERVQIFRPDGVKIGGFTLPGRNAARITIGGLVLNGVGALDYTGRSILINHPETGALITEYTLSGRPWRTIGRLRDTGHEGDRDVHLALNTGIPLAHPHGGYVFVFLSGTPLFRRYDRDGRLLYERHIEGRELDDVVGRLPSVWPRRTVEPGGELPVVPPIVRAAAVDPDGQLWVVLTLPYTYVYDASGDKVRVLQWFAAGLLAPTSLFFAERRRVLVTPGCYEFVRP